MRIPTAPQCLESLPSEVSFTSTWRPIPPFAGTGHIAVLCILCRPNEEGGLDVTCSTQYIDSVQRTIATTLGIRESTINMSVRRLGGAFGGKVRNVFFEDGTISTRVAG